jgi:hypothetical protein
LVSACLSSELSGTTGVCVHASVILESGYCGIEGGLDSTRFDFEGTKSTILGADVGWELSRCSMRLCGKRRTTKKSVRKRVMQQPSRKMKE